MVFYSNRFKELRERSGLTLKEVSIALGVAESSVHSWESGLFTPRPSKIQKIAALLNCEPNELVTFDNETNKCPSSKELAMRGAVVNVELSKEEAVEAFRAGLLREFIFSDLDPASKEKALKIISDFRKNNLEEK